MKGFVLDRSRWYRGQTMSFVVHTEGCKYRGPIQWPAPKRPEDGR